MSETLGMGEGEFMGFIENLHIDYTLIDNNPNILTFLNEYVRKSMNLYRYNDKEEV